MGEMQRPKSLFDWPVAFTKVILIVAERERERERERDTHTHRVSSKQLMKVTGLMRPRLELTSLLCMHSLHINYYTMLCILTL